MPALRAPDPPLADDRVLLRAWEDADVPWIVRESRDPEVPRFTTVPRDNSEGEAREFLLAQGPLQRRGEAIHLLTVHRASGERVGPVGLHHVDWAHRTGLIGYWTARGARGRGLTSAAVRLLCDWALGPVGLARLELHAAAENVASQRVAERCGFVREGVRRDAELWPEGRRSVVVYGLLPGDRPPLT